MSASLDVNLGEIEDRVEELLKLFASGVQAGRPTVVELLAHFAAATTHRHLTRECLTKLCRLTEASMAEFELVVEEADRGGAGGALHLAIMNARRGGP